MVLFETFDKITVRPESVNLKIEVKFSDLIATWPIAEGPPSIQWRDWVKCSDWKMTNDGRKDMITIESFLRFILQTFSTISSLAKVVIWKNVFRWLLNYYYVSGWHLIFKIKETCWRSGTEIRGCDMCCGNWYLCSESVLLGASNRKAFVLCNQLVQKLPEVGYIAMTSFIMIPFGVTSVLLQTGLSSYHKTMKGLLFHWVFSMRSAKKTTKENGFLETSVGTRICLYVSLIDWLSYVLSLLLEA